MALSGAQVLRRRVKPYVPDFKLAFEHVCIHTGGAPLGSCDQQPHGQQCVLGVMLCMSCLCLPVVEETALSHVCVAASYQLCGWVARMPVVIARPLVHTSQVLPRLAQTLHAKSNRCLCCSF